MALGIIGLMLLAIVGFIASAFTRDRLAAAFFVPMRRRSPSLLHSTRRSGVLAYLCPSGLSSFLLGAADRSPRLIAGTCLDEPGRLPSADDQPQCCNLHCLFGGRYGPDIGRHVLCRELGVAADHPNYAEQPIGNSVESGDRPSLALLGEPYFPNFRTSPGFTFSLSPDMWPLRQLTSHHRSDHA